MRRHPLRLLLAAWLALAGCAGPALQPWHTVRLREEFTADRDEIGSLEDYLRLEEALYAELDEKVYAKVPTGPEHALVRYSSGSATDPRNDDPDWNRSFELSPDAPRGGVLLLHGMSDSPYSLRALALTLAERGYHVVGLRLPGHGTAPAGLRSLRREDMERAVSLAMAHLHARLGERPIHMVGYSTGAALSLAFSLDALEGLEQPLPASLVLISPAIRIHPAAGMARFLDGLSVVPGLGRLAWLNLAPEFESYRYHSFATNAGDVVHRLTRSVDERIAARARAGETADIPPILVFKSTVDFTVTTEAVVDSLLARLAPHRHELVLFDINRLAAKSILLVQDPAPLTDRLMQSGKHPFALRLVTNVDPTSRAVVVRRKAAYTAEAVVQPGPAMRWPVGVLSLSHIAVPIAPDDPIYGPLAEQEPGDEALSLGDLALRSERGVHRLPPAWLLRMRWNPFYEVLETRTLEWLDAAR